MRREIDMAIVDPLEWPAFVPRAEERIRAKFGSRKVDGYGVIRVTFEKGRDLLCDELIRFGASNVVVRTDFPMRQDGWVRLANRRGNIDPGIAVYFDLDGQRQVIAIDRYDAGGDNLYAIARTIEALRQIERDGGPTIRAAAVSGFRELPQTTSGINWWEVLDVSTAASPDDIRTAYRRLAKELHPDNQETGDEERFKKLTVAFQQACDARGGSDEVG